MNVVPIKKQSPTIIEQFETILENIKDGTYTDEGWTISTGSKVFHLDTEPTYERSVIKAMWNIQFAQHYLMSYEVDSVRDLEEDDDCD